MADCYLCREDRCLDHGPISNITTVEDLWTVIRLWLKRQPVAERSRLQRTLIRRLRHPEVGLTPEYGQRLLDAPATGPRPRFDPPLCQCGVDLPSHDPLSGECADTGCEMFTALD